MVLRASYERGGEAEKKKKAVCVSQGTLMCIHALPRNSARIDEMGV